MQPVCSQFRSSCASQHVHAARSLCPRPSRSTAAAPGAAFRGGAASASAPVIEEFVEGIATVEPIGAVPDSHFEQHDHAQQLLQQLNALNSNLSQAIESADIVLETSAWPSLTLPADVQDNFKMVYRETRKEDERREKEERKKRAAQRMQARAARQQEQQHSTTQVAPSAAAEQPPVPAAAAAAAQAVREQLSAAQPTQQDVQAVSQAAAAPAAPRHQQRTQQEQLQQAPVLAQQQQRQLAAASPAAAPQRTRRTRSSASRAVAPSAFSSDVLSSISSSSSSSSSPALAPSTVVPTPAPAAAPAPAATAAPAAAAALPSPPASTQGARGRSSRTKTAATASPAASSSSTALAVQQPTRSNSWAPLPVLQLQTPLAQNAAPAASRRLHRSAGIGRRGGVAVGAATAGTAPVAAAKLSDNTMHGLDMRAELLTAEQEKELAVMVQDLLALEHVARDLAVQLGRTPSDLEWMEAAEAADAGVGDMRVSMQGDAQASLTSFQARLAVGRSAKQAMIKANYKLVVSICRKYQGHGMSMGDLINEGIAGLVKGVERFEPAKGFKFSTYAHWWIRQSVSRSLAEQGRLVRLPTHMQELLSRATKASRAFEAKHGREPTAEELSPELGVDAARIKDAWEAVMAPRSLDQPVGADAEGGTLGDVVEDERTIGSEEAVYIESLKKDLEGVLTRLSARDAGVLRMRFGLLDGREYTLDEVGAEFKVTRERIRQIEAKAIRELRAHHMDPGSVMADYQLGSMADKQLASRTSSGTKKQK